MVENLVAIELAYINTKHPDFHKDAALVPSLLKADNIIEPFSHLSAQVQRRTNTTPRNSNSSPQVSAAHQQQQQQQQQQHQQQQQNDTQEQVGYLY